MPINVALLRAINVGGRNLISMSDLRDLLEALGFAGGRSLLQSGNLIFPGDRRKGPALERLLEVETAKRFEISVDYFVRTGGELETIVARNPFPVEAKRDPGHLHVLFLKEEPKLSDVKALRSAIRGPEIIRAEGKHVYLVYPEGMGKSKLTTNLIERKLGLRGTARNWNTTLKLAALAKE